MLIGAVTVVRFSRRRPSRCLLPECHGRAVRCARRRCGDGRGRRGRRRAAVAGWAAGVPGVLGGAAGVGACPGLAVKIRLVRRFARFALQARRSKTLC